MLANTAAALSAGDWKSAANAANVSVSFTYGQQKNTAQSHSEGSTAQSSQVIGGGQVSLIADEGRLNITGSDVAGKEGTLLRAKDIVLQSAEQSHSERSDNKSSSRNAGVAVAFQSGKPVIGFTAGGSHGKGYGNGDDLTHRHTHIGDKDSRTVIQSSGDTTLKGAQVKGKGVALSTRNLNIESIQDSAVYRSKQQNLSGSVTVGYGASATADYNQSKTNADHRSISEQSGIFAGDDGFQVNVANHTDLKGGIITATETAESEGRNRFQTASISHGDIENHSRYEGDGFGIGVSGSISGQSLGQTAPAADSHIQTVAAKNGIDSSIGYGSDGGSQSSVTKSGIGTRNIIIGNDTDGTQAAAVYTDTRTETAEQNSGRLNNIFDKERVQNEIDLQRKVSQEFSKNVQEARTEINHKAEGYKALAKAAEDKAAQALQNGDLNAYREAVQTANEHHQKADNWQKGGVALAAVATGLSAPTDSVLGIAAATASPAVSYQIGQHFKELAKQNSDGNLTAKQETAHILAHMVLGAATAAAGDNNALAGAISAGSAEAAAPLIGSYLYGEKDGNKLTAEQKETVTAITNLLGTATGAAVGNTTANAVQGSLNAQGAVENNYGVSAISKGRRVIRGIQKGKRLTPKDALPVAEAGLVVAAACAITGNCDASQVLEDVWSGEFEDSYMASGNTDNANDKKTNAQSAAVSQSSAGAPMPPDDEDKNLSNSEKREIRSLNKRIQEHKEKLDEFKKNPTVRPGMENLPKDVIKAAQERRILHLEREIKAFQARIDILKGKAK
ncbi:hemagglutinin repeat-containing protein [Neisseria yangbaofengii]|uniref:hemagglutinin repeat-containing protein n=3 Tax=Neisseria yangbaofengii TaxID=2709396 RepID=UPI003BA12D08